MNYGERLKYLDLYSLKGRRIRGDLIETYKILQGLDNISITNIFQLSNYSKTRNSDFKILMGHSKTNIRKNSLSNRIAQLWNSLPVQLKNAQNTNKFKNLLDSYQNIKELFFEYDV